MVVLAKVVHLGSPSSTALSDKQGKNKRKRGESGQSQTKCTSNIDFEAPGGVLQALFAQHTDGFTHMWCNHTGSLAPLIVRGSEDRLTWLKDALYDFDVSEILEKTASEEIHVWVRDSHDDKVSSMKVPDAKQAELLHRAGHSLYCRAPRELENLVVPKILRDLSWGVHTGSNSLNDRNARGEIETFFSRKGHVTNWHSDFQENFTIQLTGTKKWSFRKSLLSKPLRGCTPHFGSAQGNDVIETQFKASRLCSKDVLTQTDYDASFSTKPKEKEEGEEHVVVLYPGDVLYHPAGVFHRVECLEDSVAINVSLYASSSAEIVCSAIQQVLWSNERYRSAPQQGQGLEWSEVIQDMLTVGIPEVLQSLTPGMILPPLSRPAASCARGEEKEEEEEGKEEEEEEEDGSSDDSDSDGSEDKGDNEEDGDGDVPEDAELCVAVMPGSTESLQVSESDLSSLVRNPLCSLLASAELSKLGWSAPAFVCPKVHGEAVPVPLKFEYEVLYVAHMGWGNEMLESTGRQTIAVPVGHPQYLPMKQCLDKLHRRLRIDGDGGGGGGGGGSGPFLRGFDLKDEVTRACVSAMVEAGVLAPAPMAQRERQQQPAAKAKAKVSAGGSHYPPSGGTGDYNYPPGGAKARAKAKAKAKAKARK
jgi:hypothetical protein